MLDLLLHRVGVTRDAVVGLLAREQVNSFGIMARQNNAVVCTICVCYASLFLCPFVIIQ